MSVLNSILNSNKYTILYSEEDNDKWREEQYKFFREHGYNKKNNRAFVFYDTKE